MIDTKKILTILITLAIVLAALIPVNLNIIKGVFGIFYILIVGAAGILWCRRILKY